MPPTLSYEDAQTLGNEAYRIKKMPKVSLTKKLSHFECFCKKNKWMEAHQHFFDEFEKRLDVENIVND